MDPITTAPVKQRKMPWLLVLLVVVLLAAVGFGGYAVGKQNKFEATDTPIRTFTSYEDCAQNGGRLWQAEFSACTVDPATEIGVKQDERHVELFLQYSAQDLPRLNERKQTKGTKNTIKKPLDAPADLVSFLESDGMGCEEAGFYQVHKVVPNRFASLTYGCNENPNNLDNPIIAIKLGDGWALISPTNHFNEEGVPSCLMVDMFKIPKTLSAKCFENTGYNDGQLKDVEYL